MLKKPPTPPMRARGRIPKLHEVATLAGVSPATVSRAFNEPALLNADTLARVTAAARTLRYQPNGVARSLRRNRSMTIGAVIPSFRYAYFSSSVEGLQAALVARGYSLLIATSNYEEATELDAVRAMLKHGVDGVVLVGLQHDPELLQLLDDCATPYLITWSYDPAQPCIGFDHRKAMESVVNHLLDLQHREIAVVMAFLRVSDRERDRLAGIESALKRRGIAFAAERQVVFAGGSGPQDGRNALRAVRHKLPAATALICANDLLAAGAIMECRAQQIAVPAALSITGYSDLEIAAAMEPGITTVRTPSEKLGQLAGEWLIDKLAGRSVMDHRELATELIIRGSTGPAATPFIHLSGTPR